MFYFSYRNRLRLRSAAFGILIGIVVILALMLGTFLYLERYIVYTSEGATLVFPNQDSEVTLENPTFSIQREEPEIDPDMEVVRDDITETGEVVNNNQLKGYYVPGGDLSLASDPVFDPVGSTVSIMVDFSNAYGSFYFTTALAAGNYSTAVNVSQNDAMLQKLTQRDNVYLIAAVPAFANSIHALANQNDGLTIDGGALWMDENGNYWMDPAKESTKSYLETMAYEISSLGFDEVVFTDFAFPDSANIVYDEDRDAPILEIAQVLSALPIAETIKISFESSDGALLPYGSRLYLESGNTSLITELVDQLPEGKKASDSLVFVTSSRDTRFQNYGILQPYDPS